MLRRLYDWTLSFSDSQYSLWVLGFIAFIESSFFPIPPHILGFYRDGCCNTGTEDHGCHTVCVVLTSTFLDFSKMRGNDLITPRPEYNFPGLKSGDKWCLCAERWKEANYFQFST